MRELKLLCWYLIEPDRYKRYKTLIEEAFYTEEEAFERVNKEI